MDITDLIFRIIIGGGWVAGGIYTLYMFGFFFNKSKKSLKWKSTTGTISKSYFENTMNGDVPSLEYKILYKFIVKGIEYSGDRLFFRTFDGDDKNYQRKYKEGKKVIVYFNPKNPKECVLEPGKEYNLYYLIIISLFLIIVGTLILI